MNKEKLQKQFITVYEAESDALFRYCLVRTSSRDLSLDLVQESFTRLWDAMVQGKNISHHRAFLFTVAHNLIVDWYRKKKIVSLDAIEDEHDGSISHVADHLIDHESSQETMEMNADGRLLIEKIQALDTAYGEVVLMRFVLDLKPKEIADILGESVNVISVRISRGLDTLRKLFTEKNHKKHE